MKHYRYQSWGCLIRKTFHRCRLKQSRLPDLKLFLLRPQQSWDFQVTLHLTLSSDSKFMAQTNVLNLKDFVTKYLFIYFHLDTLGLFITNREACFIRNLLTLHPHRVSVGSCRTLWLWVIGRTLSDLCKFSRQISKFFAS